MTNLRPALINRHAMEDHRFTVSDLGFLLYMLNSNEIDVYNFTILEVADRFHRGDDWFRKSFNKLVRLGYAKRDDSQNHPITGHRLHLYAVTDIHKGLDDDRVKPTLFSDYKLKLTRIFDPDRKSIEEQPVQSRPQQEVFYQAPNEKPHHTKYLNHSTMSQADLELTNFFAQYGFAMPKTPKEWEEARKPGIRAWAKVTETPLDWQAARLLNKRLIEPINMAALEMAWERWTSTSYRKERAIGVIEWYEELCNDINATPWNRGQAQYKRKSNAPKRPIRRTDKKHGTSSAKYKKEDFKTL